MSKKYNTDFKIPKHLEVPMGAVLPAPVKEQPVPVPFLEQGVSRDWISLAMR